MQEPPAADASSAETPSAETPSVETASQPFVAAWNDLVSTTNWDKGRIICQWREALIAEGAPSTEHSDEAWARHVGTVSSQHVGRLRRVAARFGEVQRDYAGLYWSHFQTALDWNDAEMWLEGAVQNDWSVSQTRHARWEALGAPAELKPSDNDIIVAELDEDVQPTLDGPRKDSPNETELLGTSTGEVHDPSRSPEDATDDGQEVPDGVASHGTAEEVEVVPPVRPFEDLPPLPDDLADALESFKVAILHHKLSDWESVSRDDVLASVDALRGLVLAPSEG